MKDFRRGFTNGTWPWDVDAEHMSCHAQKTAATSKHTLTHLKCLAAAVASHPGWAVMSTGHMRMRGSYG